MILETTRLRLRPLAASDLDALCAIAADPQVMAHVGDGVPLSRAATALWINNAAASLMMSEVGSRAVVLRDSDALIGWVGLIPTPHPNRLELIYGFARAYWGRGYATEAARALLAACTPDAVDATIDPANLASWRILEKLGFIVVGEEEDEYGLPTLRLHLEIGESAAAG
ncbi:RimJ/RimL family protein N-acetyltransferase [Phenylobacterium haematophilum]|uniref:RimJ/RimL family protein N-acetyltransferase n=1 Tax=Phenylobacterium haematophilum TaxID=98513 RepID=A0A839ZYC3_9CAUL|nr:RimJ/RimL family protein N-acetyltransferase [Phenylobacterium haematophilum]